MASKKAMKHIRILYENSVDSSAPPSKKIHQKLDSPANWLQIYKNIQTMRANKNAPVDSMGCEECASGDDEKSRRFQILVSLMISSQTKDPVTYAACQKLKTFGLTPENLSEADTSEIEKLIHPASFFRTKAKHIQQTSKILITKYSSDIPKSVEELVKLPGVGPKMAHLCMGLAWKINSGIGVDVHVHRICNRLHWVKSKTPEETRKQLELWLPKDYWQEINHLLVGFGQVICLPRSPKCNECLNNDVCPSAFETNKKKTK